MHPRLAKLSQALQHPRLAMARIRQGLLLDELIVMNDRRRRGLFDGITTVIDAGAHYGQYARICAHILSSAKIICFEPVPATFEILKRSVQGNPRITPYCLALGSHDETVSMNVSGIDHASSILAMTDSHKSHWPESAASHPVDIQVTTLDSFVSKNPISGHIYLKADVQGFELELLKGAKNILKQVRVMRLEISLIQLYEGAPRLSEICAFLEEAGFRFHSIAGDVTGAKSELPLQTDFVFVRDDYK